MEIDPGSLDAKSAYMLQVSLVVPRPIAFVTTVSREGRTNLAPFSYFNAVTSSPPIVSLSIGPGRNGPKDTRRNIEETGEFVVNAVVPEIMDAVVIGGQPHPPEVSELELAKLTPVPSRKVKPPRLAESPIHMECTLHRILEIDGGTSLVLGRVVQYHVRDDLLVDGQVDPRRITFVGRLGQDWYCRVDHLFEHRP